MLKRPNPRQEDQDLAEAVASQRQSALIAFLRKYPDSPQIDYVLNMVRMLGLQPKSDGS